MGTKEQVALHMYDFISVERGIYFRGEPIRKAEVNVRVGKLKNGIVHWRDDKR